MTDERNDAAIANIERALGALSCFDRSGLDYGEARNLLTNLGPAIRAELNRARAEAMDACAQICDREHAAEGCFCATAGALGDEIRRLAAGGT
jgi:hypothetical protein